MTRIERMINELISRRVVDVRRSDLSGDIVIREREFDTDKPIDPSTGERPVLREVETNIRISGTDSMVVVDTAYVQSVDSLGSVINQDSDIESSEEMDKKSNAWPVSVIFISLLGIFVAILLLAAKINNMVKNI